MRDPIELYEYPREWRRRKAEERIASGLYILTPDGWLRRGLTTATTASAAVAAAVASRFEDVDTIEVATPVGISVSVPVMARSGKAIAIKFAGDHAFDATRSAAFYAELTDEPGIHFGRGIARRNGRAVVSRSAMEQLTRNFSAYAEEYGYGGGVKLEAFGCKSLRLNGIAILGTTGFVEPWCEELLETKIEIAKRYDRIAVTTGRESWKFALRHFPDFQPFVFGVHIDEVLRSHDGEIVIVGKPGLLRLWAGSASPERILEKARRLANVLEVVVC